MGVSVYLENQIHGRSYAGEEVSERFARILAKATGEGLLAGIHVYGDTMFNVIQLKRLVGEIDAIAESHPEIAEDGRSLRSVVGQIIRDRGYMWVSGD